jgi:long-chain acyl-CoA synthetase
MLPFFIYKLFAEQGKLEILFYQGPPMSSSTIGLVSADTLPLQKFYRWTQEKGSQVWLTQPMGPGKGIQTWTWNQAYDETAKMAAYLRAQGWPAGSKVAIFSKNCAHWIMSDLAIWMAGYVSVPLYPTLAAETIRQILEHSEAKAVFVGKLDDWPQMAPGIPASLPKISYPLSPKNDFPTWNTIIGNTNALEGKPVRAGDELATIIYTSGTTGMPKGVMHNFNAFASAIAAGIERTKMTGDERFISYLPLAHVAERILVEQGSLATGCQLFFADTLDTFTADIQRARPTIFFSVPRLWVKFKQGIGAKMPEAKLNRLLSIPIIRGIVKKKILTGLGLDQTRIAVGGAAPMPPELLVWFDRLGLRVLEGYGMTENCAVSHMVLPGQLRPGTVGQAYPAVKTRIDTETGEIQMTAPWLMLGYYKEPELTADMYTADGWLKTGDKGQIDPEGNLKITGRVKDLFKTSKGKYVAPAPIEDRLVMNPAVEACAVVGANLGQPLGLLMLSPIGQAALGSASARQALEASLDTFLKQVNEKLDPHEQISSLIVVHEAWTVESGFITPTFKIKRNKIEEAYGKNFENWSRSKSAVIWEGT